MLSWLPEPMDWARTLRDLRAAEGEAGRRAFAAAANLRLDATRTNALDRLHRERSARLAPPDPGRPPLRLAVLASSTIAHLLPGIRMGALRRGLAVEVYEAPYGAYRTDLLDPASGLHAFGPDAILFALDTAHLTRPPDAAATLAGIRDLWRRAREGFACPLVQQTLLPTAPPLLGAGEHHYPDSPARTAAWLNAGLRAASAEDGVDLLALDDLCARHGLDAWHDPVWWLRAKQEVAPAAAPLYGDHLARILAARRGLSRKCLVLDLDNTLWGGVVGDDGVAGLVLGPGSAEGEAFLAVQAYARALAARGVILAVASKNEAANALEAFATHPEMLLARADFAAFEANWDDKARNLRRIANTVGVGLDALVFLDDNPFERELVRAELPMVAVPELPDDPAGYPRRLADAGYFEALAVTDDDRARGRHYAANAARADAAAEAADLPAYLAGLDMRLAWQPFDGPGLARVVQLVNKTNQFNLTTLRLSEDEARALMADAHALGLQFRLADRFGDNGVIGVTLIRRIGAGEGADEGRGGGADWEIALFLMSCRVLGRGVEAAMLSVTLEQARARGARHLVGLYRPSPKNAMVAGLYPGFGFAAVADGPDGVRYRLDATARVPAPHVAIESPIEAV